MIQNNPKQHLLTELDKYRIETNNIFYSLSKNLLTLAVLILTLAPSFLKGGLDTNWSKGLFLSALVLALGSAICGAIVYFMDYWKFREYTTYLSIINNKPRTEWQLEERALVDKYIKVYHENNGTFSTGSRWLFIQLVTVLVALGLLVSTITVSVLNH